MSWKLAAISLALVLRNIGPALRASLVPFGTALVLGAAGWAILDVTPTMAGFAFAFGSWNGNVVLAVSLAVVLVILAASWSAVCWHRFILRGEFPARIPALRMSLISAYALRAALITFLLLFLLFPFSAIGMQILATLGLSGQVLARLVLAFGLTSLMAFLWLRLALILPAVALEQQLTVAESWALTGARTQDILGAGAIIVALDLVLSALIDLAPLPSWPGLALRLVLMWLISLAGTGLLAILYADLVEKRRLY